MYRLRTKFQGHVIQWSEEMSFCFTYKCLSNQFKYPGHSVWFSCELLNCAREKIQESRFQVGIMVMITGFVIWFLWNWFYSTLLDIVVLENKIHVFRYINHFCFKILLKKNISGIRSRVYSSPRGVAIVWIWLIYCY